MSRVRCGPVPIHAPTPNIDDNGEIPLERVTAFVGRNESEKTALRLGVFNPDDIEAIRAEMVQVEPFPVKERGEVKALARQTSQPVGGGFDGQNWNNSSRDKYGWCALFCGLFCGA